MRTVLTFCRALVTAAITIWQTLWTPSCVIATQEDSQTDTGRYILRRERGNQLRVESETEGNRKRYVRAARESSLVSAEVRRDQSVRHRLGSRKRRAE